MSLRESSAALALRPEAGAVSSRGHGSALAVDPDARLARLRADREAHSHREIWTKEPHGGRYVKATDSRGYDPMTQAPDGTELAVPLGHERVKLGLTTNFVGDAMTQGALDLVRADIGQNVGPFGARGGASGGARAIAPREGPRLLTGPKGESADAATASAGGGPTPAAAATSLVPTGAQPDLKALRCVRRRDMREEGGGGGRREREARGRDPFRKRPCGRGCSAQLFAPPSSRFRARLSMPRRARSRWGRRISGG